MEESTYEKVWAVIGFLALLTLVGIAWVMMNN